MPRATGPIHYIEHRSPMKDETGEYLIHPKFVNNDVFDFKDMTEAMRSDHQMAPSQFVAAMESIKDETLWALADGKDVRIGDMLIIRPKLGFVEHEDEQGNPYHKVYHEGDKIPASEVCVVGFEVKTTKEFNKEFYRKYDRGCSRHQWKGSMPAKESSEELVLITNHCKQHGFITVKDFRRLTGCSDYHAREVLNGYCECPFPKMTCEKVGNAYVYRRMGV